MEVVHISAECYPAAKAGGLGDVVGALPKYQNKFGIDTSVYLPKYGMPWFKNKRYTTVYQSKFWLPNEEIHFTIQKVEDVDLGYDLFVVDIPGKFDRNGIYKDGYGYFGDMPSRWASFQRATLDYLFFERDKKHPDIIHCHDYHTGLIPFMLKYSYGYMGKHNIKTVFTIHNEKYHGSFSWSAQYLLPHFDSWKSGLLDWNDRIDPLASAIRCCDALTTVSPSYAEELKYNSGGLEWLFQYESPKTRGILNGIDNEVWDPQTDQLVKFHLKKSLKYFKKKNKEVLCNHFGLDESKPLFSFIGRMVYEKGTDELAKAMEWLGIDDAPANFIILGTGQSVFEDQFRYLKQRFPDSMGVEISYNEGLAHQIYAGSDFLLMPSRVEPCGLNQMYAIRYATLPIVNRVGGLKDSVIDISLEGATGITFGPLAATRIQDSIYRAIELYRNPKELNKVREQCLETDFSWENSTKKYIETYESIVTPI